jgi:carbamoyltransferase
VRILGIYDDHNCGCAIVEHGTILAAIEEERLSRIKFHNGTTEDGLPIRSLTAVLEMTGSDGKKLDRVAVAVAPPAELLKEVLRDLFKQHVPRWFLHSFFSKSIRWDRYFLLYPYWYNWVRLLKVKALLRKFDLGHLPIDLVDHHTAHAATAYYTGGKNEALVVTLDGQGDGLCGTVFLGKDGLLEKKQSVSSFHSIGLFYNLITWMLGFKPNRHEGKITGLAAYGDPERTREAFEKLFVMDGAEFRYELARHVLHHAYPHRSNYPKFIAASHGIFDSFKPEDIAAGIQELTENSVCKFIDYHLNQLMPRGETDICLAGGVFANVKVNQRVAEITGVKSVYIFPAMGDGGLCAGAALKSYYDHCPNVRSEVHERRLPNVYLGPEFSEKKIEDDLKKSELRFEYVENIEDRVGEILAEGHVVARFNGRMEYGPRALGNRSILYQPTDPTVNDWLNKKLKRTEFMPFAPATLMEEDKNLYLRINPNRYPAEFMTITFDCTEKMQKEAPATVHVDGTARPQLVTAGINESYYKIIKAYQKRSGLPTVINTSFNMHEEPIVCTPDDAIRAFKLGHLEYLAIGRFLVFNTGT